MLHEEDDLQMQCVAWFEMQYKAALIHHSPNGGKRSMKINKYGKVYCPEGSRFKKMGQKAGFPDLLIITPKGKVFFIEMKSEKGKLNENQIEIHKKLQSLKQTVHLCNSFDSFVNIINFELTK